MDWRAGDCSSVVEDWQLKLDWIPDTACFLLCYFLSDSNTTEFWIIVRHMERGYWLCPFPL